MISCICIDDSFRPNEIPLSKWVKKGQEYHVIYAVTVLPSDELAFDLYEIELTDNELPYEHFLASRFGFTADNLVKLAELMMDCVGVNQSVKELIQKTNTIQNPNGHT
jgi:hypothetical protein